MGPATAFLAALLFAFLALICAYKIALNLLTFAAGESFSPEESGARDWSWPRDRKKIVGQSLALGLAGAVLLAVTYACALRAFGDVPHLTDRWKL